MTETQGAAQEMTLDEYVRVLPKYHRAHKELAALEARADALAKRVAELGKLASDAIFMLEAVTAQLHSWGYNPSVNVTFVTSRAAALLDKGGDDGI